MSRTYQDSIRLDFQVTTKGQEQLSILAKDLDRVTNSINKLNDIGVLLDKQNKGFSQLARRIGLTNKALKRLEQQTKKVGKSSEKERKRLVLFGEDVAQLAGKISLFAVLTGPIIKTFGYIADQFKSVGELEESMARVATVTRSVDQSLSKALFSIRREVLKTSRDVKIGFNEITIAAFAAGSAGLNVSQQIASIRPISTLVVGTLADMEFTAKLVTGSFNVFSEKLGEATTDSEKFQAIADTIADTFSRQQIELSELEAGFRLASSAASILDVDFNELVTTLGFLNTGMLKGSRSGTALLNAFIKLAKNSDKIKESFNVAIDPTKPLKFKDIMLQIAEQMREGGVSTEEFRKLIDIFGIRGARAVAQIVNNIDRYRRAIGRSYEDSQDMAEVLARIQTDTLAGSFQTMTNSLGESLVLLNDIVPVTRVLSGAFKLIGELLGVMNLALGNIAEITSGIFDKIGMRMKKNQLANLKQFLNAQNKQIEEFSEKIKQGMDIDDGQFSFALKNKKELEEEIRILEKLIKTKEGASSEKAEQSAVSESSKTVENLRNQLEQINKEIAELEGKKGKGLFGGLFSKDSLDNLKKYRKELSAALKTEESKLDTLKQKTTQTVSEISKIPESVLKAAEEMDRFVRAGDIARQVNGDIFKKVFDINNMLSNISKRMMENETVSEDVKKQYEDLQLVISKNLELDEERWKATKALLDESTKHVAAEKEVQDIYNILKKLLVEIGDKRKEIADLTEKSIRSEQERFQIEMMRLQGAKDEDIARQEALLRLQEFNRLAESNLTLEEARKMTHAELLELAGQKQDAVKAANELEQKINDTLIARTELMVDIATQAKELADEVNNGLKESLFESLKKAEKLEDAFNNAAKAVGDILLKQQFDNLFAQLNKHFNLGAITIESQIGKGGSLFIQQLESEMPRIAAMSGKIFADNASTGLTNASQTLNAAGTTGDAASLLGGGGTRTSTRTPNTAQAGGGNNFGNIAGGALTGYALAQSQGQGTGATVGSVAGAAIGNAIVPGIGGLVGGMLGGALGGLFDKKKKPKKPKRETEPFKLDVANTHLDNINRNLVGLRQDTKAYALPSSFYFSATQRNPLSSGITINGDFVFNGVSPSGEPGDAISQFEQSMSNILAEQINRGAQ